MVMLIKMFCCDVCLVNKQSSNLSGITCLVMNKILILVTVASLHWYQQAAACLFCWGVTTVCSFICANNCIETILTKIEVLVYNLWVWAYINYLTNFFLHSSISLNQTMLTQSCMNGFQCDNTNIYSGIYTGTIIESDKPISVCICRPWVWTDSC